MGIEWINMEFSIRWKTFCPVSTWSLCFTRSSTRLVVQNEIIHRPFTKIYPLQQKLEISASWCFTLFNHVLNILIMAIEQSFWVLFECIPSMFQMWTGLHRGRNMDISLAGGKNILIFRIESCQKWFAASFLNFLTKKAHHSGTTYPLVI
jgi:hypothetical protein